MSLGSSDIPSGATIVVIGGANTDVVGSPDGELVAAVSNPGTVRIGPGGVGRNIAENVARLGIKVHLITAFGDDEAADLLRAWCMEAGIGVSHSVRIAGQPGARYLAINDGSHDLAAAVSDMRVLAELKPEELEMPGRRALIDDARVVVLDTNVPMETIEWVAAHTSAPVMLDPVSAAKAPRAAQILGSLDAIKPNTHEAAALLGHPVSGIAGAEEAARELVHKGVKRAFVTAGPAGVAWADASSSGVLETVPAEVVNTNGAGDAFSAGIAYGMLAGMSAEACAELGAAMSSLTLCTQMTVDSSLNPVRVAQRIEEMRS